VIDTESLSCQEVVELVTEYLDGVLSPADLQRFEAHIADCDACTGYLEQLKLTIELTGTLTIDDLSPDVESALLDAFRTWRSTQA
jgi:anti-sigma factor RsiW